MWRAWYCVFSEGSLVYINRVPNDPFLFCPKCGTEMSGSDVQEMTCAQGHKWKPIPAPLYTLIIDVGAFK